MSPPNSRIVTAESCELLKRLESEHVPKNTLPFAANALLRPVAAGEGELPPADVDVGEEGVVTGTVVDAAPGRHCE